MNSRRKNYYLKLNRKIIPLFGKLILFFDITAIKHSSFWFQKKECVDGGNYQ